MRARVALELVLGGFVVDHGAHLVVDDDELVDAGAAAEAAAAPGPGRYSVGEGSSGSKPEQAALVFAGLEGLLVVRVERAHQALRDHADEARRQQEGLDAHVAQARDARRRRCSCAASTAPGGR